jgi:F-type H+-transporting ATPase subunit delta
MAETVTIARPYAEAVFKLALEHGDFVRWSDTLELIAQVTADPGVRSLIGNPNIPAAEVEKLLLGVCGKDLDGAGRNLIQVLAHNRRLDVVPEIRTLYEALKAEHEGVYQARIYSAFEMDDAQLSQLVAELETKYGHKISATVDVDPSLIGGVKVVIGDRVLDTTIRGRLNAMAAALTR